MNNIMPLESTADMLATFAARMKYKGEGGKFAPHVAKLQASTRTLADVFNNPNPTQTAAAQSVRVAKGAKEMAKQVESVKSLVQAGFGEEMAKL